MSPAIPAKHLPSVPYTSPATPLQTLDIWLPEHQSQATNSTPALWILYMHGGAWRDPTKDSHQVDATLAHLFTSHAAAIPNIAGIASLNYRLSPYPTHVTNPSTPDDASRNARHPDHVRDVVSGIHHLQRVHGMRRWIGVGHSCGATLLMQLVSGIGLDKTIDMPTIVGPEALILLEGIYNIPLMLQNHSPPVCPEPISTIYKTLVKGAFGDDDEHVYMKVSPVAGKYNAQQWPEGRLLVICHSYEDELVERAQRDVMCVALDREGWSIVMEVGDEEDEVRAEGRRVLNVRDLRGTHDWVWEDGKQIATLIAEVVGRLA
ncbi:alpha beta-hydrolase [Pyrenophora seminiperda CCB06]|uniref:Kynurenine formamidase n=1 Tax=Pyrenophora seminiperda CCB06 TaxID=1302712 RepID=A0A3M7M3U5_9PLEO|nr:alpha beta-hydrolase [Pyrenophora seminiperda CCB06]